MQERHDTLPGGEPPALSVGGRTAGPDAGAGVAEGEELRRDQVALRAALARELDTINEYERLIGQASSPTVRQLLAHLRDEEKEHVAECMLMLRRLDAAQDAVFAHDVEQLMSQPNRGAQAAGPEGRAPEGRAPEGRAPEGRAPEGRTPEKRPPESRTPGGGPGGGTATFTVGSLKSRGPA